MYNKGYEVCIQSWQLPNGTSFCFSLKDIVHCLFYDENTSLCIFYIYSVLNTLFSFCAKRKIALHFCIIGNLLFNYLKYSPRN